MEYVRDESLMIFTMWMIVPCSRRKIRDSMQLQLANTGMDTDANEVFQTLANQFSIQSWKFLQKHSQLPIVATLSIRKLCADRWTKILSKVAAWSLKNILSFLDVASDQKSSILLTLIGLNTTCKKWHLKKT